MRNRGFEPWTFRSYLGYHHFVSNDNNRDQRKKDSKKTSTTTVAKIKTWCKEENVAIFRRYIAEISCVGGYRHDISWRNIGPAIFRHLSREIADFSRYIGDLAINRRFFSDISCGQRGSTKVKPATVPVNALQCLPFCLLLRGFEPQTKRFGVHPLTTWAK
uniref:Uncharacterized protein n=1 Tax=Vitis vinifera TaxID=29760 RepID=A5CAN3_VITVI|nr:hypothetical protein VITISV_036821 [Vitis vinifera]